jgi:ion channel-forming bestrophin family protein
MWIADDLFRPLVVVVVRSFSGYRPVIVRDKPTAWELFFVYRGSAIVRILPQMMAVTGLTLLLVALHRRGWAEIPIIAPLGLTVIGATLSIFAAFRNSASYERWWEARKVAGLIVIEARNLARQAQNYIAAAPGDDLSRRIALRCITFMQVTRDHLRDRPIGDAPYLSSEERVALVASRNPANRLLGSFSADIAAATAAGRLSPQMARTLEDRVVGLTLAYGMLERTKATPIPFAYTLAIHRITYLFCFLLPFGLSDLSSYWAPLLIVIISYIFFGLDALAGDLEAPFADTFMVVPLDAMTRAVEINVLELLGEKDLPEPIRPKNFVLT